MNKKLLLCITLFFLNFSLHALNKSAKLTPTKRSQPANMQNKIAQIIQYSRHVAKISGGGLLAYLGFMLALKIPHIKANSAEMVESQAKLLKHTAEDLAKIARFMPKGRIKEMQNNANALFDVANMLNTTSYAEQALPGIAGLFGLVIVSQGCDGLVKEIKKDTILFNSDEQEVQPRTT